MGTPGWKRLAIGGDEMRAGSWGGRQVREDAVGSSSINQKGAASVLVLEMKQQAAGGCSVYNPPAEGPFPAPELSQEQGAWQ